MKPPPYRRRMRNVLIFLYSGLYNVTYPKGQQRGRGDSSASPQQTASTKGGAGLGAPLSEGDEKEQYEKAMRLLKNLDYKMSGGLEAGVPEGPPPATGTPCNAFLFPYYIS